MPPLTKDEIPTAIKSHAEMILGYSYAMGKSDFYPSKEVAENIERIALRIAELAASVKG